MTKKIVFLDMDGVLADFAKGAGIKPGLLGSDPPAMFEKGFYLNLPLIPLAKEAVDELATFKHLDLHIASKPTSKNLNCATEKFIWIKKHFPYLLDNTHIISNKGLLLGNYLIDDDRERWEPVFQGKFIHFNEQNPIEAWTSILAYMEKYR